jgi:NAD(P)-dependent dehydrogenase (short-subunit alcohol dehydrogenase family)
MKLDGATVLITGGAIRFGAYLCRAFARRGAKLIIHYRNSYAEANALLQELGSGHQTVFCDLRDTAMAENMIRTFAPDVLINNAASYDRAPLTEEKPESAAAQYAVNALTPIAMLRTLAEVRKGRETAAVNILDCAVSAVPSVELLSYTYITASGNAAFQSETTFATVMFSL